MPGEDESAICMMSYRDHGRSANTDTSAGMARAICSSSRVRCAGLTDPDGYDEKRIHTPETCALSRSNFPTKNGWSTSSWYVGALHARGPVCVMPVTTRHESSVCTVTVDGKSSGRPSG